MVPLLQLLQERCFIHEQEQRFNRQVFQSYGPNPHSDMKLPGWGHGYLIPNCTFFLEARSGRWKVEHASPHLGFAKSKLQGFRDMMCKYAPMNMHKDLLQSLTGLPGCNIKFPTPTPGTHCSEFSELVKIQLSNSLKAPLNKNPSQKWKKKKRQENIFSGISPLLFLFTFIFEFASKRKLNHLELISLRSKWIWQLMAKRRLCKHIGFCNTAFN